MITIRVPATTANLGLGFDCLGMALNCYARFSFEKTAQGLHITGSDPEFLNQDNLVYQAFLAALKQHGVQPQGLLLHIDSDIPPARGLGSSAACVAGGIQGANELYQLGMSSQDVFELACALEGHPDNAAPAVFGGLQVSMMEGGRPYRLPSPLHPAWQVLALIPDFSLKTAAARAALPALVSLKDACYNLSHTAFLLKALENGEPTHLRLACQDRLHQDARFALIPGGAALKTLAEDMGAAACWLSGAGPALMCLYQDISFKARLRPLIAQDYPQFTITPLALCGMGAAVERTPT
ncbi:MAG: homoserine kinase [Clostridiales bacterium]|nr:homoserine kinase [Clostridiales bacterium]